MKEVKFLKDVFKTLKRIDKKGSVRRVTDRHANRLVKNKAAEILERKENKQEASRKTK